MAIYQTTEQLYTCASELFAHILAEDPHAADPLLAARLIIHLRLSQPAGEIWINGRSRPVATTFGPATLRPDLVIDLTGDTLHKILLNELSVTKALGSKQLIVKGPVWKATVLADLFRHGQSIYPAILRKQGLH
jgi:hypothetical protein